MTIFTELGLFIAAFGAIMLTKNGGTGNAAPNPAMAVHRIDPTLEEEIADEFQRRRQSVFAPKPPPATIEDDRDAIDDIDAEIRRTIDEAKRLNEQKRTMLAALRVKIDLERIRIDEEEAKLAARDKELEELRASLPPEL